jgi:hypothetical protein
MHFRSRSHSEIQISHPTLTSFHSLQTVPVKQPQGLKDFLGIVFAMKHFMHANEDMSRAIVTL